MRLACLAVLAFVLSGCAGTPDRLVTAAAPGLEGEPAAIAGPLETLRRATLLRDRATLRAALTSPDASVRVVAVRGLGQVQEAIDGAVLASLAADPDRQVREEAAIALGLLGLAGPPPSADERAALEAPLVERAALEHDRAVLRGIAWALGRIVGPRGATTLATLAASADATVRAEALLSLGLVARKAPADAGPIAARAAVGAWRDVDPEVRAAAAFALVWSAGPEQAEIVAALARDGSAAVRAFAARALGEVAPSPSLGEALTGDRDPVVRIEAIRGLQRALARFQGAAGHGDRHAESDAVAAFEGALLRAAFLLSRGLATGADPEAAQPLELLLRPGIGRTPEAAAGAALGLLAHPEEAPVETRSDVARLHCAAAASLARIRGVAGELGSCGAGLIPADEVRRLEAVVLGDLVDRDGPAGERLLALAADPVPVVRAAAVRSLGAWTDPSARTVLASALAGPDVRLATAAADAVGREGNRWAAPGLRAILARRGVDPDLAAAAIAALAAIGSHDDHDRNAVRHALGDRRPPVLAAARSAAKVLGVGEAASAPTFEARVLAANPPTGLAVRLETNRGPIRIGLDVERAPVASANLAALAERGFLDGTPFHRIEPGYVAQGGDPHGDGTGSPGYSIPCENAATAYRRGTVGMALGGKDTGGSQFFVTYAGTPQLEGRFTVVGEVTSGMDAVQRLLPGDRILHATVERPAIEPTQAAR